MPFRTPPGARRDLLALIDAELRDRIEEAVDHAMLEAIVSARRAHDAPLPKADDPRDREEFTATVRAFLERLRDEIPPGTDEATPSDRSGDAHEEWRLLAIQVGRAKALPDYWQRFDAARLRFTTDYTASGGPRRGVLGRLFGRG